MLLNSKKILFLTTALSLPVAANAGAYYEGSAGLEYVNAGSNGQSYYMADVTLGYVADIGSWELGAEATVLGAYNFNGNDSEYSILPEVYLGSGFGRLTLGYTDSAAKQILPDVDILGAEIYDSKYAGTLLIALLGGQPLSFLANTALDENLTARFDGSLGSVQYSLSYTDFNSADVLSVAAKYDAGNYAFSAAVENYRDGGSNEYSYSVGAETDIGAVSLGALAVGYSSGIPIPNGVTLNAGYDVNSKLSTEVRVSYFWNGGGSQTIYGLGIDYEVIDNLVVGVNYDDSTAFGSNSVWSIGATYNF